MATRQNNPGSVGHVLNENMPPATASDIGLTRKAIHEARKIRDAEKQEPGIVASRIRFQAFLFRPPAVFALLPAVAARMGSNQHYYRETGSRNVRIPPLLGHDKIRPSRGRCVRNFNGDATAMQRRCADFL